MIKIENADVYGWQAAIRGMRNPLNSWSKSDSWQSGFTADGNRGFWVGENDLKLMKKLVQAGPDHAKFLRMVTVTVDLVAPLYWWKEFDTYKVGTVANSCSTMHKLTEKEFTLDDFSHEHLFDGVERLGGASDRGPYENPGTCLEYVVDVLNYYRQKYLDTGDKRYWWQLIQLLPSSYNQRRTVYLNYAVLRSMYHARKNHKLNEWRTLCEWVETLPYAELITG